MDDSDHCAFVETFFNLPGITIKEKHQSFYKLLQANSSLISQKEALDGVIPQLKPTTLLDRIHYIDFLIYFKRFDELFLEFQSGNEITLSKIAKHDWFFERVSKEAEPLKFVNEILPTMGFNVRMKILKKLRPNEEQSDKMFEALQQRYGTFVASVVLAKCSSHKIKQTLSVHNVKLTARQLKVIFNKDPSLVYLYIERRKEFEGNINFLDRNPILVYIAQKNPDIFSKLVNEHKIYARLGRRTTKHFVGSKSTEVLEMAEHYVNMLHNDSLVRNLGHKSDVFLLNLFPRTPIDTYELVQHVIKHYPKKKQFPLYKKTFNALFHDKFGQRLHSINSQLLCIVADVEEREKLASMKFQETDNGNWLKHYKPSTAFGILKQKLDYLTTQQRADYLSAVVDSCFLTKDFEILLKVLEFIITRLINDSVQVLSPVLKTCSHERKLISNSFSEQHWKYLMVIANLKSVRTNYYHIFILKLYYISFAIKNNLPARDEILEFRDHLHFVHFDLLLDSKREIEKQIVIVLLEHEEENGNDSMDEGTFTFVSYLLRICGRYNKQFPTSAIDIFKYDRTINRFISYFPTRLDSMNFFGEKNIENVICVDDGRQVVQNFQKLYFENMHNLATVIGIFWFIKHKPELVGEYFEKFFGHFRSVKKANKVTLWRLFKQYSHLNLDLKMIESCTSALKNENYKQKEQLVLPLSVLMTGISFLEFTQQYLPLKSKGKVDLRNDKVKEVYGVQIKIIKYMKNIDMNPETYLSTVRQCCKGDYLKAALCPLYSCLYRIPERKGNIILDNIRKEPGVSFQKHGIALACTISDAETVSQCFKNNQLQHLLPAFKYFAKNNSDRFWQILKMMLSQANEKNVNMLNLIMEIKIPVAYREDYTETAWQIIQSFGTEGMKKEFLRKIDKSNIIGQTLIKFIKSDFLNVDEISKFTVNVVIFKGSDDIIETISKNLCDFKKANWEAETTAHQSRVKLSEFINNLFTTYLSAETETRSNALMKFKSKFEEIFNPVENFQDYVKLSLMIMKGETVDVICKAVLELYHDVIRNYNETVVEVFWDIVKNFRNALFKTEPEKLEFCHTLFKLRINKDDDLLVISLLPQEDIGCTESVQLYNSMLTALKSADDDIVRLHLNLYLIKLPEA